MKHSSGECATPTESRKFFCRGITSRRADRRQAVRRDTGYGGGLLFYGDPSGYFLAADERDGKTLWRIPLNATIKTSPVTYAVDGKQFVTLAVGSNVMTFGLPD